MKTFLVTICVIASVVLADDFAPCDDYPCPEYEIVFNASDYYVRENEPVTWLATAPYGGLKDYFSYIIGYNYEFEQIDRALPAMSKYAIKNGVLDDKQYVAYYIPMENPPQPLSEYVFLSSYPRTRTYQVDVEGELTGPRLQAIMEDLLAAIPQNVNIDRDHLYVAKYQWIGKAEYHEIGFLETVADGEEASTEAEEK